MSVLLKKPIFAGISQKELVEQLEAAKKCQKKLPAWFETSKIYYPKKLNIEQTSSEKTAAYKSQIVNGNSLLDLTGGFGVDSYFFSKKIDVVFYTEIDPELAKIAAHNFKILGADNINDIPVDGIVFLENTKKRFDTIYLDPSRRHDLKGRVFRLSDCVPNVLKHLELLLDSCDHVLLKTSPLLDLSKGIKELQNVCEIHIVAVNNEVKELIWKLEKDHVRLPSIKTINIKNQGSEVFEFDFAEEAGAASEFSEPLQYLYEPNAAILKSGAFKLIGQRFSLKKLHEHSHLYTSNQLHEFPGRRFRIESVIPYGRKTQKKLDIKKGHVAVRNFPKSVAFIRKKMQLDSGGEAYLFFTKIMNNDLIVLKCLKIA
ncbi:MAG: class I SAM-dependent methyltransferase [Aurantibacter sp.]